MKLLCRNNKQVAAACWLMLMLVVHGVKLLHNHANRIDLLTCHAEANAAHTCAVISEDHGEKDCSVCEYKLAKDTDHFIISLFSSPSFITFEYLDNKSNILYSFLDNASNKGPPSLA